MEVRVEVELTDAAKLLFAVGSRARDFSPVTSKAGKNVLALVKRQIEFDRDPYGAKWRRLSPKTIAIRKRRGTGTKILIETGKLFAGLYSTSDASSFTVGLDPSVYYGKYHNTGVKPWLPKRMFLPDNPNRIPPAYLRIFEQAMSSHFKGLVVSV